MKDYKVEVKWALIYIVVSLLWMALERLFGLHDENIDQHANYTNFFYIPAIAVFIFALRDKRKNFYSGVMTYKQGFITGLIITLIITILMPPTQWVISTVIAPDYFPNMIDYVVRTDRMTQEAAENAFNLKNYLIQVTIGTLIFGLIISAIAAIFMRKKVAPH